MSLLSKNLKKIISRNTILRRFILLGLDAFLIFTSIFLTSFFINDSTFNIENYFYKIILFIFIGSFIFIFTGQYKAISMYVGGTLFYRSVLRNFGLIILYFLLSLLDNRLFLKINFLFLNWILLTSLIVASRLFLRDILHRLNVFSKKTPKVIIYGAGNAGAQLASSIKISGKYEILGFIDDSPYLIGRELCGFKIYSFKNITKIPNVDIVLIAIPSLDKASKRKIIKALKVKNFDVLQMPSLNDLTSGKVSIDNLQPVELEDLLGRETVLPDQKLLSMGISNLVVCVTGGGGSIGSELSRQIVQLKAKKIILIDNCEHNLYKIYEELKNEFYVRSNIIPILGDVSNTNFVNQFINRYKVDLIFHAAAYKHVPMVEQNPITGLINNVLSTYILCSAVRKNKIKNFILISTDKAVRPTNIMGVSKRLAEMIVQAFADDQKKMIYEKDESTKFSMVRFGNVLGSSGSVIPLFKRQIKEGGPITLTHNEITRFFMTIKEAVELVIQSVSLAENGDLFLLDMGEPVKIKFLAEELIRLSGLKVKDKNNPTGDIEIICTGLRSGEKLYEELLINAKSQPTSHPLIFKAKEAAPKLAELEPKIKLLKDFLYSNKKESTFLLLAELVPEWKQNP